MNDKSKSTKIDETTLIPISLLIVIIGAVFWFATLHSRVSASEKEIEKLTCTTSGCLLYELKQQGEAIARIEGALGTSPKVEQ